MPYQTHGLRHDTDHLFAKLLTEERWLMTPCVVIWEPLVITCIRLAADLLEFPAQSQVICGWPGKQRQDVFEFTVGQFRAFVQARDHIPQEGPMSCVDEKPDEPKKECDQSAEPDAAESDAGAEGQAAAEGTCEKSCEKAAEPCKGSGDAPAQQEEAAE